MEENKTCDSCGYCKIYPNISFCECSDRYREKGIFILDNFNEAMTCKFYDDDSWMK